MNRTYKYIEDPNIYAIFDKETNLLIISLNPEAIRGIIVIV